MLRKPSLLPRTWIFCVLCSVFVLDDRALGGEVSRSREAPRRAASFSLKKVERSKSTLWFEGFKAGRMQFLQSYVPDHRDGQPLVVGLAGGTGSGKTTIKDIILSHLSHVGREPSVGEDGANYQKSKPHGGFVW